MALKTDYKDDILDVSQNTKRKYTMIENQDGTVSFDDETVYSQEGDSFGASDINAITEAVNSNSGMPVGTIATFDGTTLPSGFEPYQTEEQRAIAQINDNLVWKTHVENEAGTLQSDNSIEFNMPTTWKEAIVDVSNANGTSTTNKSVPCYSQYLINSGKDHYTIGGYYSTASNFSRFNLKYDSQNNKINILLVTQNGTAIRPGYTSIYYR